VLRDAGKANCAQKIAADDDGVPAMMMDQWESFSFPVSAHIFCMAGRPHAPVTGPKVRQKQGAEAPCVVAGRPAVAGSHR